MTQLTNAANKITLAPDTLPRGTRAETQTEGLSEIHTDDLRWLQITASLISLIGVAGLLALMTQGAWAADPNSAGGLRPGARTFTNPFANAPTPGGRPSFFEEDDEDELSFPPPGQSSVGNTGGSSGGSPGGGSPSGGTPRGGGTYSTAGNSGGNTSMGGGPNGGVVTHRSVQNIEVNNETGDGSKELVTDFNFPDADILDIAKTLGKLTGKNFILDKDVKGRITIVSNSSITVGDAWRAFLTALDINGFALIPSGKYIRIARQRDARDKQLKTYSGEFSPDTDALITRVFQLKYIDSEEVARTFRSFMPANSRIIPYDQTNTVIVTDTGSNISKLAKMLELLDVEGYDLSIEVIPVKFASASELSKLIDQLIPGTGGASAGAPGGGPRFGGMGGRFNARRTKEGGVINTIIGDERTNTLIVNANVKGVDQVKELVARLDQKLPAQTGGGKVHVMYLQFADAEAIANTLNNLSSSGPRPSAIPIGGGTGINPVSQNLFEGSIKVAADKATNSLVITASPSDFVTVQRVVGKLDIPRDEVFVEVVLLEVSMSKTFDYSASIGSPTSGILSAPNSDFFAWIQNPASQTGAVLPFKAGNPGSISVGGTSYSVSDVQGLIKAIQSNSKSNVLATPQIIALDNTDATFESTEKVPIPKSSVTSTGVVTPSIEYQPVTLSIKIKPQINKRSNFVKLDITTKIGSINTGSVPKALQDQAFSYLDRSATTTVVAGDADTIVIGGLMRDRISETVNKIPLLGDIPILGWLFRAKSSVTEKTNLLVFLTPHIVRQSEAQYAKVRSILDRKLKDRDDMIEADMGGEDPHRKQRDKIIRSLPNLEDIMARRNSSVTIGEEDGPAAVPAPAEEKNKFKHPAPAAPAAPDAPAGSTGPAAPAAGPETPTAPPAPPTGDVLAPLPGDVPALPSS